MRRGSKLRSGKYHVVLLTISYLTGLYKFGEFIEREEADKLGYGGSLSFQTAIPVEGSKMPTMY